jgi:hypothetical protein
LRRRYLVAFKLLKFCADATPAFGASVKGVYAPLNAPCKGQLWQNLLVDKAICTGPVVRFLHRSQAHMLNADDHRIQSALLISWNFARAGFTTGMACVDNALHSGDGAEWWRRAAEPHRSGAQHASVGCDVRCGHYVGCI